MTAFEDLVRAQFEPAQYVLFFGLLMLLGSLEVLTPKSASGVDNPNRRRRWPTNAGLTLLNILILGALPFSGIIAADLAAAKGWGLFNQIEITPLAALALGILLRSLVSYATHVAFHKVPLFWRFHRVHHSDRHLDVSTTVRVHPLEFLTALPILLFAVIALGLSPLSLLLYELLDVAIVLFSHAHIRLPDPLDRTLRLIVVTPNMHRVHHSAHQPDTDSNYGATLSCWDRLFGTYRFKESQAAALGLSQYPDARTNSLFWLLGLPFRAARASSSSSRTPDNQPKALQ